MGRFAHKNRESEGEGQRGGDHGSLVGPLVGLLIARHPSFATNPVGDWKELVGEQVSRYCQPRSLKEKVLVVAAYDSVWKHHLELHKSVLMEKINLGRAEPLVEKIVVRVGELSEAAPPLNPLPQRREKTGAGKGPLKKRKKTPSRPLTTEEKAMLKGLPDADLRAVGTRLLKRTPAAGDQFI
jgi:hypothetical protein